MKGVDYEQVWELLGETHEAVYDGEPLPIIDPDDICSDDDLEWLGWFGEWDIEPGHRSISTGPRSAWINGEPTGRTRWRWLFGGWSGTTV